MTQDHERRLSRLEAYNLMTPLWTMTPRQRDIRQAIESEHAALAQQADSEADEPALTEADGRRGALAVIQGLAINKPTMNQTSWDQGWNAALRSAARRVESTIIAPAQPQSAEAILVPLDNLARLRAIEEAAIAWSHPMREKHRLLARQAEAGGAASTAGLQLDARLQTAKTALKSASLDLLRALDGQAPAQPPAPAGTREAAPDFEAAKPRIDILALLYQARTHLQFVTTYMGTRKAHEELEIVDAQLVKAAELFCAYTAARQGTVPEWAGIGGIKGTSQEVQDVLGDLVEAHADDCFYTSGLNDGYGDESCSCALQSTIVYLRCLQRAFEARDTAARQSPPEPVSVERPKHQQAPPQISEIVALTKGIWHADDSYASPGVKDDARRIMDIARAWPWSEEALALLIELRYVSDGVEQWCALCDAPEGQCGPDCRLAAILRAALQAARLAPDTTAMGGET